MFVGGRSRGEDRGGGGEGEKIGKGVTNPACFYREIVSWAQETPNAGFGSERVPDFFRIFSRVLPPSSLNSLFSQTMLSTILGFSAFGFAARVGQLAIQKRPLFSSESGLGLLVLGLT
jgi:hypothetical protein